MAPPEIFLTLVNDAVRTRGRLTAADYLPIALTVAHRIPENERAEDAAAMFIRWIYEEPFQVKDAALRLKMTPQL
jgi:hypothetical protein